DQLVAFDLDNIRIADGNGAFSAGLQERGVNHLCRATNMERTHGQLGTGFTDRLRGDNAHSFTHVHWRTACKVTTIAGRAGALAHVAGQWRTDTDRLD